MADPWYMVVLSHEWIEAIGTWVAPILIFWAGKRYGERDEKRKNRNESLYKISEICQKIRHRAETLAGTRRNLAELHGFLTSAGVARVYSSQSMAEMNRRKLDSEELMHRLALEADDLAIQANICCMMVSRSFGLITSGPMVSAIKRLLISLKNLDTDSSSTEEGFDSAMTELKKLAGIDREPE